MKRIFLIVQKKDNFSALASLRELGVVHVEFERPPEGEDIQALKEETGNLKSVVDFLEAQHHVKQQSPCEDWKEKAGEIIKDLHEINQMKDDIAKSHSQIAHWESWGNFCPQDIEELRQNGLCARLFKIPVKEIPLLEPDIICEEIFVKEQVARCLVICKERKELPFEEVALPSMGLEDMKRAQKRDEARITVMEDELREDRKYLNSFKKILEEKESDLRLQQALAGMGEKEEFSYLKGFCPNEACPKLQAMAKKEKWAFLAEDPSDDDRVPTLLRNPKWVEFIKPVFSMMNILPGYRELDISFFFLIFLSAFFGILIGDAGYGLVFLGATAFAHIKLGKKMQDKAPLFLMYILSSCTIIWGMLTGTFFGQAWLEGIVSPLLPWLRNDMNMQKLCFMIGAVHLSVAHIWRGVLKAPSLAALAEVGWISIIWGMFFVAQMLILGKQAPGFMPAIFIFGSVLVIFFSQPKKNIFKAAGAGAGNLLMSIVNMFTDLVSYIRLFAVGLATVAVADAFNQMAMEIGFHSVLTGLATSLILVLGHLLNISLGAMAILVHGIRLNVLEFSSHLNMEWSGIAYHPFRKKI